MASVDRANRVLAQMQLAPLATAAAAAEDKKDASSKQQSLTVIDNRTGKRMELPIQNNTVVATKFLDMGLKSVPPHTPPLCAGPRQAAAEAATRCSCGGAEGQRAARKQNNACG
jgi:hypothetical protein